MRKISLFAGLLVCALAFAAIASAQDNRVFDWTPANSETIPLEPASLHAGRTYHPAAGGGNMHVDIESRYPVTVAMAWADEWNTAMQHPGAPMNFDFLCVKEHVTRGIYECHLPSERPMIITFRDERRPEKPVVSTIGVILGPGARPFFSPNDLHIQYYSWTCVNNCIQPCFEWRRILNEKYEMTAAPKAYSLMTPDHDGQELSVKIKSPIPLTVALLPSHLADQVYDKAVSLTDALDQTGCKERGVQSMSFNCTFNVANGSQTLFILPDINFSGHKKANVEVNTVKCVDHCDLLSPPLNP
ncbi:MAG TPA: hypothetical protein VFO39_04910 [Candidatus Sulfotelmatobacter sp.]|nr:hypothetical protein [Candidatus Sulfotelmatobacter sp.]